MSKEPKKLKLLVADEDKDIRFLIKVYLREYEIDYLEARDGNECLITVKKELPDILLINYMLEKLNGYQVAGEIAKDETLKHIIVIMMTLEGFDLTEDRSGINDYLPKPFNREAFISIIKKTAGEDVFEGLKKQDRGVIKSKKIAEKTTNKARETIGADKKKILIADDEPEITSLLKTILEKDYELDLASSGIELIEKAKSKEYDLIISDVIMPKLSGWKSVKKIREDGNNVPIIFNSGLVKDKELYETLKPDGPSCFLLKPFKKEDLLSLVEEMLNK